ncbi:MAG TPA: N-acetyltransferase [Anaerolineaceae bacterium]|jgi:ribosomal protein S18 acetylase RimI-like enzyme|nr:N-acetyltransferase [Anaerolineaceae bacterium]
MEIRELDQGWKGKSFLFRYTTTHLYRVNISHTPGEDLINLKREALPEPLIKSFESSLYSGWLTDPKVFAAFEEEKLLGFIELSLENWNNRLRIANIWVDEDRRHQGIGKILIAKAVETAKVGGQRALVLETQSCNDPAIRFYQSCGFELIGLDTTHYNNDDIQRGEVRLEFGMSL